MSSFYNLYNDDLCLGGPTEQHLNLVITNMKALGFGVTMSVMEKKTYGIEYSIVFCDDKGHLNIRFSSSHLNPVEGRITNEHPWATIIQKTRGVQTFNIGRWMDKHSTTESSLDFRNIKTIIERIEKFKIKYSE